jgi:hypothetical protein
MLQQGQAALLVLAFVAGQIGSYVHAAVERHAVCPEHGEIIHVPEHVPEHMPDHGLPGHGTDGLVPHRDSGLADEDARAEASPVVGDALRDASAASDEHAHEHCYLCPASRESLTPGPSGDALAAAIPEVAALSLPAVVATSDRARYIIAPKTSPPV